MFFNRRAFSVFFNTFVFLRTEWKTLKKESFLIFLPFIFKERMRDCEQCDLMLFEDVPSYLHKGYHCELIIQLLYHIRYKHEFVKVFSPLP